jgi:hypothetical protein
VGGDADGVDEDGESEDAVGAGDAEGTEEAGEPEDADGTEDAEEPEDAVDAEDAEVAVGSFGESGGSVASRGRCG